MPKITSICWPSSFDPPYLLRLAATDLAGNSTTLDRLVHVDGRLKLGNFTLGGVALFRVPLAAAASAAGMFWQEAGPLVTPLLPPARLPR